MKKRLLGLLLSLTLAAGMLAGCGSKAQEPAAPAESGPAQEEAKEHNSPKAADASPDTAPQNTEKPKK